MVRDVTRCFPKKFDSASYELFCGEPTKILLDGDTIELGDRKIQVIHTPGHSPWHLCFFDEQSGSLFTGDLLYSAETPIYANYPSTSPSDLLASLKKLCCLEGVQHIFPSHNLLELPVEVLKEVEYAADYLCRNNLAQQGTGLHDFQSFRFLF